MQIITALVQKPICSKLIPKQYLTKHSSSYRNFAMNIPGRDGGHHRAAAESLEVKNKIYQIFWSKRP